MRTVSLAAIAATYACVLMACGGTDDGRDYRAADAGTTSSVSDAGERKDASEIPSDEDSDAGVQQQGGGGNGGSSGGGSGGGGGVCAPGGACGGLYYCNDDCYSDRCCDLVCTCSDSSGLSGSLECSLSNCQN